MYRISRFVRVAKDNNRIVLYNYRTGGLYFEHTNSLESKELVGIINGNIDEKSDLFETLLSREFLVRETENEYETLKQQYENYKLRNVDSTIRLTIFVNEMCNFQCVYCYEENEGGEIEQHTLDGIICFLKSLIDTATKTIVISWFGGEPLLSISKIVEFMNIVRSEFTDLHIMSSVTTNGYLLEPSVHSLLQNAGVNEYQITVDSFEHDIFRKTRSGEPSFEKIIENIRTVLASNTPSKINLRININPAIYSRIFEFLDYVKTFANDYLTLHFHPIADMGGYVSSSVICDQNFFMNALPDLNRYCQNNHLNTDITYGMLCPFSGSCYAGLEKSFAIDCLGVIRKCTVDYRGIENVVGYIEDSTHFTLLQESNKIWCMNHSANNQTCQDCEKLPVCYGAACPLKAIRGQFDCNKNVCVEESIILQASYNVDFQESN